MNIGLLKKVVVFLTAAAFLISCGAALAAEKAAAKKDEKKAVQWVVIKDKNDKCRVIKTTKGKTEKTFLGPYATEEEARKAKDEKCPKPTKPLKKAPDKK